MVPPCPHFPLATAKATDHRDCQSSGGGNFHGSNLRSISLSYTCWTPALQPFLTESVMMEAYCRPRDLPLHQVRGLRVERCQRPIHVVLQRA
jgi:hypothetical protein